MTQFRIKPLLVDAWQWEPTDKTTPPQWVADFRGAGRLHMVQDEGTALMHLEAYTETGFNRMDPGDWLIRATTGDIEVVDAETFVDAFEEEGTNAEIGRQIDRDVIAALREWVGFSAAVIKSGEGWSSTCEDAYQKARQSLSHLKVPTE